MNTKKTRFMAYGVFGLFCQVIDFHKILNLIETALFYYDLIAIALKKMH